ncbi:hypothetical protein BC351_11085 [Paenibacillus ferrarius]|uniref:Uncharacterized protein n=1 Tax=Paenibacillus ferrarius TaxID=1469647 RepID=A0A1V4H991_9BACL|nr:hypothetical protein [Paenibacillus ferrarius]OPH47723.1 hypothetical protein BC351_11085 [Paenibacillus ferrarius]
MTIAISLKVNDGLVLAADSASSILIRDNQGHSGVINVYDNANKVFNIHKELPIGAITWGCGSIGVSSISTLVKDFRDQITNHTEHLLNTASYTMQEVAEKFYEFIYTERYQVEFASWQPFQRPSLGFILGGYSSGATLAEIWRIDILEGGISSGPYLVRNQDDCGVDWQGAPEAIARLIKGYSQMLPQLLLASGLTDQQVANIIPILDQNLQSPLILPAMPIQDLIDIADFLADLTKKYVKFTPGPPTVGGPVDIAVITKYEGFKWIKRKHYFDNGLN